MYAVCQILHMLRVAGGIVHDRREPPEARDFSSWRKADQPCDDQSGAALCPLDVIVGSILRVRAVRVHHTGGTVAHGHQCDPVGDLHAADLQG